MIGIYKITSPSGRVYIGQSRDIERRWNQYSNLFNCSGQVRLYRSFIKHGVENHIFEVIEECSIEKLNERERYWQDEFDVLNGGLNLVLTATKLMSRVEAQFTKSSRIKSLSGENHYNYGNNLKEITKLKISNSLKGKKKSESLKNKLREANIGKILLDFTKNKIREANLGKHLTDSVKLKMSLSKIGVNNPKSKKVINSETGEIYDSITQASKLNNINNSTLKQYLSGSIINKTNLRYVL